MRPRASLELTVPVNEVDHVRGPAEARLMVIEYEGFECPVCRAAEPGIRMLE